MIEKVTLKSLKIPDFTIPCFHFCRDPGYTCTRHWHQLIYSILKQYQSTDKQTVTTQIALREWTGSEGKNSLRLCLFVSSIKCKLSYKVKVNLISYLCRDLLFISIGSRKCFVHSDCFFMGFRLLSCLMESTDEAYLGTLKQKMPVFIKIFSYSHINNYNCYTH